MLSCTILLYTQKERGKEKEQKDTHTQKKNTQKRKRNKWEDIRMQIGDRQSTSEGLVSSVSALAPSIPPGSDSSLATMSRRCPDPSPAPGRDPPAAASDPALSIDIQQRVLGI